MKAHREHSKILAHAKYRRNATRKHKGTVSLEFQLAHARAGYAKWINKVSLPRSKLVNTSKKFTDRYIRTEGAVTHSHGPKGEHAHEDVAFTTWIDFNLAAKQARANDKVVVEILTYPTGQFLARGVMATQARPELDEILEPQRLPIREAVETAAGGRASQMEPGRVSTL